MAGRRGGQGSCRIPSLLDSPDPLRLNSSQSPSVFAAGVAACIGILRFRKGPEDVPASTTLLVAAVAGVVLLNLLMLAVPSPEAVGSPVLRLALELAIALLGVNLMLRAAGHAERFVQTVTAIFGCQLLLAPALLASGWIMVNYYDPDGDVQPVMLIPALVALYLLIVR